MLVPSLFLASLAALPPNVDVDALLARVEDRPVTGYITVHPPTVGFTGEDPLVIYMNRHGGTFMCDDDDARTNKSSIACSEPTGVAHVGGFSLSDAAWQTVMSCVQDMYAPFRIVVTDVEPLDRVYVESVVGGQPTEAGMSGSVAGVSPFACDVIPYAIVYTFADVYGDDVQAVCETVAQETAHAFGLDHEYLASDPMTYLDFDGQKRFQDVWAPCGEYEPRECSCGGDTQNSVAQMTELFGAADGTLYIPPVDRRVPEVALIGPSDGDILDANTTITVVAEAADDVGLTVVELEWDFSGETMFCPSEGPSYACVRDGNTYTWSITVGEGMRSFRVHVRDGVGNDVTTETREVWLSKDGSGPSIDVAPPTVVLGAPLSGGVVSDAEPYDIVASILDDTGIAVAALTWRRFGGEVEYPCPFQSERVSCAVEGSTYRWTIHRVRAGDRTYKIRAVDVLGKTTISPTVDFVVEEDADVVYSDGNDAIDEAETLTCGAAHDVDGDDADWFAIDAPPEAKVVVSVDHEVATVVATDGTTATSADGDDLALAPNGDWRVGVTPTSARGGGYTVRVACELPPAPAPVEPEQPLFACGATERPATLFALLALLGLRRRRA